MPTTQNPPVRVRYWLETPAISPGEEVEEVSWATWAAMTDAEREAFGESLITVCIENTVTGGWEVDGPQPPPATEGPIPPPWGTVLRAGSSPPPLGTPLIGSRGMVLVYGQENVCWDEFVVAEGPLVVIPGYHDALVGGSPSA